ncbi:ABC transporter permease [Gordonia terrae]|uniref:ABC transporter permease n=1 Tax=Gordonia terrae TaxID=2055 RepID=A0A2I1R154_9ACTN|nr:ABC transporter permease [Gordonia terrae]PKZ62848.1 ABC transporter permease [Gordonia terrae]
MSTTQTASASATAERLPDRWRDPGRWRDRLTQSALAIGLLLLVAYYALNAPAFLDTGNLRNILVQAAIPVVVAVPLGLLVLAGHFDLSVGSGLAVAAVVAGLAMQEWGLSLLGGLVVAIAVGLVIGAVNGVLCAVVGLSSLIVTLGGLAGYRGLAQVISPDPVYGFSESVVAYGNGAFLGVPYLVITAGAVIALGWWVLEVTSLGKHIRAVGVSPEAAYLSGVRTKRIVFGLFAATGALVGVAAMMSVARLDSAPATTIGSHLELDVLTAVLLGGIMFGTGYGKISGVVLGVLFLTVLQNGLTLMNVPPAWAVTAKGVVLVAAAGLQWMSSRKK